MTPAHITLDFAALQGQQFMNLITFRKNGQPVSTPVWMAQEGSRVYVMTGRNSGKIKRIRHTSRVQVEPSDRRGISRGPAVWGTARLIDGAQAQHADRLLTKKYGMLKRLFDLASMLRPNTRAYIEIVPAVGE
ncbi:MAG TPA: PPOX class F420-dependent oxidoreductase [Roseiflexaceae bacterium]|nr:PPOX class F420-dependent oxidoreductase [Roseiflexaceae bacterium]